MAITLHQPRWLKLNCLDNWKNNYKKENLYDTCMYIILHTAYTIIFSKGADVADHLQQLGVVVLDDMYIGLGQVLVLSPFCLFVRHILFFWHFNLLLFYFSPLSTHGTKTCLARNQDNVSEWSDMSTRGYIAKKCLLRWR